MSDEVQFEWLKATVEIRMTNADIPNPDHDRRCRRGYRAQETIKAGTRFKVFKQDIQIKGKPETRKQYTSEIIMGFDRIKATMLKENKSNEWKDDEVPNPLYLMLMAHSDPCEDLKSIFALHFQESMSGYDFAKAALEKGWLTIEQVKQIVGE